MWLNLNKIPESFQLCLNGGVLGRRDLKRLINEVPGAVNQYLIPVVCVEISLESTVQYLMSKTDEKGFMWFITRFPLSGKELHQILTIGVFRVESFNQ